MFKSIYFAEHLRTAASENTFVEIIFQAKSLEVLIHQMVACSSSIKFAKIGLFQSYFLEHLRMVVATSTSSYVKLVLHRHYQWLLAINYFVLTIYFFLLSIFAKIYMVDVWLGSEYDPV